MSIKLNTGAQMPINGFGVWKLDKPTAADSVYNAIKTGYRLIDAAQDYGNCIQVGEGISRAIKDGLVKREELFITSKLWNNYHEPHIVELALDRILSDMKLDYLDLFLMHFPIPFKFTPFEERYPAGLGTKDKVDLGDTPVIDTWRAMEKIYKEGKKVKAIGVSNFSGSILMDLLRQAEVVPAVSQFEHHPYLQQLQLVRVVQAQGIAVTAYSSFGNVGYLEMPNEVAKNSSSLLEEDTIVSIASKHKKTPAQVLLRWATQRGIAVIPKSNSQHRLKENLETNDFDLDDSDFAAIAKLERNLRYNNPHEWDEDKVWIF